MQSKDNINRRALKAGLWYTLCNFVIRGISFLTTPIFTRILSKADYGAYSNYASWLSLLTILTTLDLYTSISRAKFDFGDDLDNYVSSIQVLGTIFTGICYMCVLSLHTYFENLFGMKFIYINIMFIYMLVAPSFSILQAKHRQFLKYKSVSVLAGISTIGSVIVSIILVLVMEDDLFARIVGSSGTLIIMYLFVYIYNLLKGRKIKKEYWRYAITIAVPLIPHVLAGNILGTSDRIMISKICGSESTALYSVIYSCSLLVMVLFTSLNQAWAPWFYEQLAAKNYHLIKKTSIIYIVLSFCFVCGIMLLGPEIVLLFGGKRYAVSASIVPSIMLGTFYWSLYSFFVNTEIFYKKTLGISSRTVIAAVFNVLANYIFIPLLGWEVAAYTTLAGYFLLLVLHSNAGKKIGTDMYFERKFFYGIAIISFFIMIGIRCIYPYFFLRTLIVIIILICIMRLVGKNRQVLKKILKK